MPPFYANPSFLPREIEIETSNSLTIFLYIFSTLALAFCVKLVHILFRLFIVGDERIHAELLDAEPDNNVGYGTFQSQLQRQMQYPHAPTSLSASGNGDEIWARYRDQVRGQLLNMFCEMGLETNHVGGAISERESSDESDQTATYTSSGKLSDEDLAITDGDRERERQETLKESKKRVRFAGIPVDSYGVGSMNNRLKDRVAPPPYAPLVGSKCGMMCENSEIETNAEGRGKRTTTKRKEFAKGKLKSKSSRRSMGSTKTKL